MVKTRHFDRRQFLKTIGFGLGNLAFCPKLLAQSSKRKAPNVIIVITDDQGYGDFSCHGHPDLETRAMDNLYSNSVRLEDFHVSPTCAPTRAALLTGHYTNRTGAWHTVMGRSLLFEDEVTMADIFSQNKYRTGIFGKWHLGDNYPFRPQDRGFQETVVHGGGGVWQTSDYWGNDYIDDVYLHNGKPRKYKGYCTDVWFDEALDFIEKSKEFAFFCYLSTNAPHDPYNVPKRYVDYYRKKGVKDDRRARFYGMIQNIDENMARLDQRLKELDLFNNTILIFTTDNGTSAGEYNAGMRARKGSMYEGGHRVPCFIRWPQRGIQGGKEVNHLTAHIDILPTLIELCEFPKPEGLQFDGKSLVPLLINPEASWTERILITDSQRIDHPIKWRQSAVMTNRWRLINGNELYDITAGAGQKNDISNQNPQVVQRLRDAYEEWWKDIFPRFEKYARIIVGSNKASPVHLTCHDWHTEDKIPWHQNFIRQGIQSNGYWMLNIESAGEYEFGLRRWPVEVNKLITAPIPGGKDIYSSQTMVMDPIKEGKAIKADTARIKIREHDVSKPIPVDASVVRFRVKLDRGPASLQTWFTSKDGESRGAYYVSVKRL